jgi:hypothetical protein
VEALEGCGGWIKLGRKWQRRWRRGADPLPQATPKSHRANKKQPKLNPPPYNPLHSLTLERSLISPTLSTPQPPQKQPPKTRRNKPQRPKSPYPAYPELDKPASALPQTTPKIPIALILSAIHSYLHSRMQFHSICIDQCNSDSVYNSIHLVYNGTNLTKRRRILMNNLKRLIDEQKEMLKKHGWIIYYVVETEEKELNGLVNIHTYGLLENFNHLDLQIVIPVPPEFARKIFFELVERIKEGTKFTSGERNSTILRNLDVMFIEVESDGRRFLRLLLPDPNGKLPQDEGCATPYNRQLENI